MIHLHDRATMAHALTLDLDPRLRALLAQRIAGLKTEYGDLTDYTEFLVVQHDDSEAEIVRHVGFSPLVDAIDGYRWPDPRFEPGWSFMADRDGCFEIIFTFGSSFASIVLLEYNEEHGGDLVAMCRRYTSS